MEHLKIVKQKFSNKKKNYFRKETFADGDFRAFAVFGCNFVQNMLSAKKLCARNFQNWSSAKVFVRKMTKVFQIFYLFLIFLKIF